MTPDEATALARLWLAELERARAVERGALMILSGLIDLEPTVRDVVPDEVWADAQRTAADRAAKGRRRRTQRA